MRVDVHRAVLKGRMCLVCGWDMATIHINGLVKLGAGGLRLEVHRISMSDAIQMSLSASSSVPPRVHLAAWRGSRCMRSLRERITC